MNEIVKPEQFGAVGDGIHNDAFALRMAIRSVQNGGTVSLEPKKTYYIGAYTDEERAALAAQYGLAPNDECLVSWSALTIHHAKNITIEGDETTLLLGRLMYYADVDHSENIVLRGLIFDYRIRPYVLARALELDIPHHTALVKCDRSLWLSEGETARNLQFGVLDLPDQRYHMFIESATAVDTEKFIYRIVFEDAGQTIEWMERLKITPIILPVPGFGQCVERAFSITYNHTFTMQDCTVHSMARFGFAILRNSGKFTFDHVCVEKAPDEPADIVGWRDCFHIKENHGPFLFTHCYAEHCYDDIFNISASSLAVHHVYAEDDIDFRWPETNEVLPCVEVGDEIYIIDVNTGKDYGTRRITEIVEQEGAHNRYRFDGPFTGVGEGDQFVSNDLNMVAPGTVITDCDFRGTFRLRGPIEVRNTFFYNKRFWIDSFSLEGPVPKHIHFKDCEFVCDSEDKPYFHINAYSMTEPANREYHIEDLVFEHCILPEKTLEIREADRPYVSII